MRKTAFILLCFCLLLTACSNGEADVIILPSAEAPPLTAAPEEDALLEQERLHTIYAEEDLPQNTPSHQAYIDKYFTPYAITGIFAQTFSPDDTDSLEGVLMTMFEALRQQSGTPSDQQMNGYRGVIPRNVVEDILTAYFPLTREQIREYCAEQYDPDRKIYNYLGGLGGGPAYFVIAGSREEGDHLILDYDWYVPVMGDSDELFFGVSYQGTVIIEEGRNSFRFLANEVTPTPGITRDG